MAECCCAAATDTLDEAPRCPVSGARTTPVDLRTVKALLTETALARLSATAAHRFCADPSCDIVYVDAGGARYLTSDLRVPVWQKARAGSEDRIICYCFGESEARMRRELEATGRSLATDRVRAHIAAGRCACDLRNPRGACCLGDLGAAIARVTAASGAGHPRG